MLSTDEAMSVENICGLPSFFVSPMGRQPDLPQRPFFRKNNLGIEHFCTRITTVSVLSVSTSSSEILLKSNGESYL